MFHHSHFWPAAGAATAFLQLTAHGLPPLQAQEPRFGLAPKPYCVQQFYDRVTDSSRAVATLSTRSRAFGLGARVSIDVSYSYPGRHLMEPPGWVTITLESFTPARGGWAFARPRTLEIRSPAALKLEVSPAEYRKHRAHLFDRGRRELLSFRIATGAFVELAAEPELSLRAGGAVVRVRGRRMELVRQVAQRLGLQPTEGDRRWN
ncbi:MAG: hypothetical protein H0T50_10595 [Gemmatimonadales bacterium]|nr:hypothetical protein [Gemmatimonadales bacterium]